AMVAALVGAWASWLLLARRSPRFEPWLVGGVVMALLSLGAVNALAAVREDLAPAPNNHEADLAVLAPVVLAAVPDRGGDVVVRTRDFFGVWYTRGLLLALERSHVRARTDIDPAYVVGNHRVYRGGPVRAVFRVALQGEVAALLSRPGARLVAFTGTRSLAEYRRLATRLAALKAAHDAGALSDKAFLGARPGCAWATRSGCSGSRSAHRGDRGSAVS